jgi:hypothetical protein
MEEETYYSMGFDSLWSVYGKEPKKDIMAISSTPGDPGTKARLMAMLIRNTLGGISPTTKETSKMGYNDYNNDGRDSRSNQDQIDDAVRERIEKPRREAEIAKRVALVTALESLATAEVGTVIAFVKKLDKKDFNYAAVKSADDRWSVTGDGRYSNGLTYVWSDLLTNLTTGPDLAENVQVATGFSALQAPAATDASA